MDKTLGPKQNEPDTITYEQYYQAMKTIIYWENNKAINKMTSEEMAELEAKLNKCWETKRKYIAQNNQHNK